MAKSRRNPTAVKFVLVVLAILVAFVVVTQFLSKRPDLPAAFAPTPIESAAERTARLGRERSDREWGAAQKRADARNADDRARRSRAGGSTAPE